MKHNMHVEFTAHAGDRDFREESVVFQRPAELYKYVSPGGGCERIPNDVEEIQMILLPHYSVFSPDSPMDELPATLELGMIFLTGPLSEIVQVSQQLLGKASRGELSSAFMRVAGLSQ